MGSIQPMQVFVLWLFEENKMELVFQNCLLYFSGTVYLCLFHMKSQAINLLFTEDGLNTLQTE